MFDIRISKSYRKDFKRIEKSGKYKESKIRNLITKLSMGEILEASYNDHKLHGDVGHLRECHIESDLLMIYEKNIENNFIELIRIGNHSDLF